jgi:Fic family protein
MIRVDTVQITPEVLNLIAELDEFKGAWQALGSLAPERLSALRRVATIESIGSSTRIEGSKLTDREVERLLSNLEIKTFATRDEQEVAGYAETMELICVLSVSLRKQGCGVISSWGKRRGYGAPRCGRC